MFRRQPPSSLFPYTTLFRSLGSAGPHPRDRISVTVHEEARRVDVSIDGQPFTSYIWKRDRKSTRLNSSHRCISYAVFCLKKKIIIVIEIRLALSIGNRRRPY